MTVKNYFSEFFKKQRFITVVVLSVLFTSFFVFDMRYGFLAKWREHVASPLGIVSLIFFVFFSVLFLLLSVFRQNEKETCFIYSLSLSFMLTGIANIVFLLIVGRFSVLRLLLDLAIILGGVVLLFLKVLGVKKNIAVKTENKLTAYLRATFDRYTFIVVLLFAAVNFFIFSLIIKSQHPYGFNFMSYILLGLFSVVFVLYNVFSAKRKDITLFDAVLSALIVSSLTVLVNIVLIRKNDKNLPLYIAIWAVAVALLCVMLLLRIKNFASESENTENPKCYFTKTDEKYGILSYIFAGSLFGVITMILFRYSAHSYYFGSESASFYAIPYVILNAFAFLTLIYGEIYALITVKRKCVNKTDGYLLTAISYSVFALLSMAAHFTLYGTIILAVALAYSAILTFLRIKFITKPAE